MSHNNYKYLDKNSYKGILRIKTFFTLRFPQHYFLYCSYYKVCVAMFNNATFLISVIFWKANGASWNFKLLIYKPSKIKCIRSLRLKLGNCRRRLIQRFKSIWTVPPTWRGERVISGTSYFMCFLPGVVTQVLSWDLLEIAKLCLISHLLNFKL